MSLIERSWYKTPTWTWVLFPFTLLFGLISFTRTRMYRAGLLSSYDVGAPVIIVGNISVGGNGKTPVVIWLVEQLQKQGHNVGVVSRGYGGKAESYPMFVTAQSKAQESGDEPLLIAKRCGCPVAVAPDRVAAAKLLVEEHQCNVIISDDGMQHYRLKRQYEIAVVDGVRRFGNGWLMPMGPLREPTQRLNNADTIICNGGQSEFGEALMSLTPANWQRVDGESGELTPTQAGLAIAGIGHPQRFFDLLSDMSIDVAECRGFEDHQAYQANDFSHDNDNETVLMTEKDAVKCGHFAKPNWWYLPVDAVFSEQDEARMIAQINNEMESYGC